MNDKHEQPLLLTTKEAATYLHVSRRTLEGMRSSGGGPKFIKFGPGKRAKVFYRRGDLETWLDSLTR